MSGMKFTGSDRDILCACSVYFVPPCDPVPSANSVTSIGCWTLDGIDNEHGTRQLGFRQFESCVIAEGILAKLTWT